MPHQAHASRDVLKSRTHCKSGVDSMTKLIHRNKYVYGLAVLALLALSSGAGMKWS